MFETIKNYLFMMFAILALMYLALLPALEFPANTILKPLPILALLAALLRASIYWQSKAMLALGIVFSILGDIALTLPLQNQLQTGLGLFLIAHIAYICGFLSLAKLGQSSIRSSSVQLIVAIGFIAIACVFLLLLWPRLGVMKIPVSAYIIVITLMAISTSQCHFFCLLGASIFLISDSMIAVEQFIFKESFLNFWIMLSYYLAQFFLIYGAINMSHRENINGARSQSAY